MLHLYILVQSQKDNFGVNPTGALPPFDSTWAGGLQERKQIKFFEESTHLVSGYEVWRSNIYSA